LRKRKPDSLYQDLDFKKARVARLTASTANQGPKMELVELQVKMLKPFSWILSSFLQNSLQCGRKTATNSENILFC
jgi:hypothetical protein